MYFWRLSLTFPKARKDYRCIWCGGEIPKGYYHLKEAAIFEGDFQSTRWHGECMKAAEEIAKLEGAFEIEVWDNVRPDKIPYEYIHRNKQYIIQEGNRQELG